MEFNVPDKNQRKYQCFVCGVQFQDFFEYKQHIIDKHEEGREYVLCPLQRCGAPVRDMRTHFRVKHPNDSMPKVKQVKALIWKDFSAKHPKGKTRKPKFREGNYESTKMKQMLHYRSGYECTVYECLDSLNEVHAFAVEPFEIPYIYRGEVHKYTPDIIVSYTDGRTEVWEVKPANQTALEKNQDKWQAAEKACEVRGWKFVVVTEQVIEQLKKKVREQNSPMQQTLQDMLD